MRKVYVEKKTIVRSPSTTSSHEEPQKFKKEEVKKLEEEGFVVVGRQG